MHKKQSIINETAIDLIQDFEELIYLFTSTKSHLTVTQKQFQKKKKDINPHVYTISTDALKRLCHQIDTYLSQCIFLVEKSKKISIEKDLVFLIKEKERMYQINRSLVGIVGSTITMSDWQSPSFLHSLQSLAGRQSGEITGTINDYKRDQHNDEKPYEDQFLKEYIDGTIKIAVRTYAVHSGMAAFITILGFIKSELREAISSVILSKGSYFENKTIVQTSFANVIEIDETDTKKFCDAIQKMKPAVIFLDTLGNNPEISVPNLTAILQFIKKNVVHETILVIDNTCLSVFSQPFRILGRKKNIRLLVFESLNKYHQFGMDKITGGIVWGWGKNIGRLFNAREHSGTNISDSSIYSLPKPSKKMLTKRLLRFERNAYHIANTLNDYITNKNLSYFQQIYYPGLSSHKAYHFTKDIPFRGSFFAIALQKKYRKVSIYQAFVKQLISEAKKHNLQIVSGTSFGMNTARIYLTATRTDTTEPFIRFSVGIETRYEIEKMIGVFQKVFDSFAPSLKHRF